MSGGIRPGGRSAIGLMMWPVAAVLRMLLDGMVLAGYGFWCHLDDERAGCPPA